MKLIASIAVLLMLVAAAFWSGKPQAEADIVFVSRGDVFTLDPQRMSYVQDFRMAYALYEGLLRWNNEDFSIEPAAASLPEVAPDNLTYTFHLRSHAKWSNGEPVTAHDFVYSWQRLIWPDTAADYSNLFFIIQGASEFFSWRLEQLSSFVRGQASQMAAEGLFDEARRRFESTVGIRALDDFTLQVTLHSPCAYFLDLVCFAVCYPVHRPTVEGWPDPWPVHSRGWVATPEPSWRNRRFVKLDPVTGRIQQKHEWARPGTLVSNGPYVLRQWRYKRDLRLAPNSHYHSPGIMRNRSVLMRCIEDANTAVLAYESGGIDWLVDVAADYQTELLRQQRAYENRYKREIAELTLKGKSVDDALAWLPRPERGERRDIHSTPVFGTDFYSFNCRARLADGRANPFADARVRRAFAMCVDREAIVEFATRLNEPTATTLIPRGAIAGYHSPAGLRRNLAEARAELARAGWIDRNNDGVLENAQGDPFPPIDLLWSSGSDRYKWISLELKSQWEQALGVRIELRAADTKFYKDDLKQGKFMIARGRWYGDYGDPTTFLDINKTGDGNNDRGFSDAHYDSLLNAAAAERQPDQRMSILQEAERYLIEEQTPLVPICQLVQLSMYEPGKLRGLSNHPRLVQYLWKMERVND